MAAIRDHGGGIDAQIARFGGSRETWLDVSTGINPVPYPIPSLPADSWTALPDAAAEEALVRAARAFWQVPEDADILAAPGASSLIARLPALFDGNTVDIPQPTYNEHAAAFEANGWKQDSEADVRVLVHPNNPTGRFWDEDALGAKATILDESFCDIAPERSLIARAGHGDVVVLKSFGKFWGLAGMRLGFLIASKAQIAKMRAMIGPWAVSGPALTIATAALKDQAWATETRARLEKDSAHLDALMIARGAEFNGGTPLFRLYKVADAQETQDILARHQVWTRIFPYSKHYLRLGLPSPGRWEQLETALSELPR